MKGIVVGTHDHNGLVKPLRVLHGKSSLCSERLASAELASADLRQTFIDGYHLY
jgi:hypothetical protein